MSINPKAAWEKVEPFHKFALALFGLLGIFVAATAWMYSTNEAVKEVPGIKDDVQTMKRDVEVMKNDIRWLVEDRKRKQ